MCATFQPPPPPPLSPHLCSEQHSGLFPSSPGPCAGLRGPKPFLSPPFTLTALDLQLSAQDAPSSGKPSPAFGITPVLLHTALPREATGTPSLVTHARRNSKSHRSRATPALLPRERCLAEQPLHGKHWSGGPGCGPFAAGALARGPRPDTAPPAGRGSPLPGELTREAPAEGKGNVALPVAGDSPLMVNMLSVCRTSLSMLCAFACSRALQAALGRGRASGRSGRGRRSASGTAGGQ